MFACETFRKDTETAEYGMDLIYRCKCKQIISFIEILLCSVHNMSFPLDFKLSVFLCIP